MIYSQKMIYSEKIHKVGDLERRKIPTIQNGLFGPLKAIGGAFILQ
jgi:mannose/fructose/N-acetylgalactosamine-specific phosphotransferase system component IID